MCTDWWWKLRMWYSHEWDIIQPSIGIDVVQRGEPGELARGKNPATGATHCVAPRFPASTVRQLILQAVLTPAMGSSALSVMPRPVCNPTSDTSSLPQHSVGLWSSPSTQMQNLLSVCSFLLRQEEAGVLQVLSPTSWGASAIALALSLLSTSLLHPWTAQALHRQAQGVTAIPRYLSEAWLSWAWEHQGS